MSESEPPPIPMPPILPPDAGGPPQLTEVLPESYAARPWRRVGMLLLLTAFILSLLVLSNSKPHDGPALPGSTGELLKSMGLDLGFFAVIFSAAFLFGRPTFRQLYADHGPTPLRWVFGFVWSIGLRFGVGIAVALILTILSSVRPTIAEEFQPQIANVLPIKSLLDPVYLVTMCTFVSFVSAGFREELWRAGVIFALSSLLPLLWTQRRREMVAVFFAAFIFGLGHTPQGVGGVVLTGILGIFLGLIMVYRRSLWEAVIAHGFFDAASFLLLRILADRDLLQSSLTRLGVPESTIQKFFEELGKRYGL